MHDPMTVSAKALQVLQARLMAIHHVLHLNAAVMHFDAGFRSFTVCGNWVHSAALTTKLPIMLALAYGFLAYAPGAAEWNSSHDRKA